VTQSDDIATPPVDRLDLLKGAAAIASYLGLTERQVYHYLEAGNLPAKKVGKVWIASPKKLREFFEGAAI
jgi:hypothetical protein